MFIHNDIKRDITKTVPTSSTQVVTYNSSELEERKKEDWKNSKGLIKKLYGRESIV